MTQLRTSPSSLIAATPLPVLLFGGTSLAPPSVADIRLPMIMPCACAAWAACAACCAAGGSCGALGMAGMAGALGAVAAGICIPGMAGAFGAAGVLAEGMPGIEGMLTLLQAARANAAATRAAAGASRRACIAISRERWGLRRDGEVRRTR